MQSNLILSDRSILREIKAGNLVFDPPLSDEDISPSSVDVHLGDTVQTFKQYHPAITTSYHPAIITSITITSIDLSDPNVATALDELLDFVPIPSDGYSLQTQKFILAYTMERITLPPHIAARLEGRSTNARFGISIHSTAPTVHPTFTGHLVLEIYNFGTIPCILKKGMAIGQLIFEYMDSAPMKTLQSAWQGQKPPAHK